jgi:simple sugar transport system ATP-binding protein
MSTDELIRMENVTKTFPGVVANDDVTFSVRKGEIHGLLGENGAGKSTLMKILYGLYSADEGEILLDGDPLEMDSPQDAINAGIGMVHQHFKLIPRLSVAKNIVLGMREPASMFRSDGTAAEETGSWTDSLPLRELASRFTLGVEEPQAEIQSLADDYGFDIDPTASVWELGVGEQQRVEILKALYRDVNVLILDEPTAVLTPGEAERLFDTLRQLADRGMSIIIITHKLDEVDSVTDRATILREGKQVGTVVTEETDSDELARMMVGRDVLFNVDKGDVETGTAVLEATNLRADDHRGIEVVSGVDLTIDEGEIVGLAGVSGNGQKQLAEMIAGTREPTDGNILLNGTAVTDASARTFIDRGVSFVPEDRHVEGCAGDLSVMHNSVMKRYGDEAFADGPWLDYDATADYAEDLVADFDVRGISDVTEINAGELSGGNLQKLILAREMARDPDLLVAQQPTRGVDVGAIEFIRERLVDQQAEGTGILLLSEDLDELFDLSDRILVIYEGEIVHEATPENATKRRIGMEMNGASSQPQSPSVAADGGRTEDQ